MKKISIPEVAELVCDLTGKSAVASIKVEFWYGSTRYGGRRMEADLCDEVANVSWHCSKASIRS